MLATTFFAMFSALASLLLLGAVPTKGDTHLDRPPPGIEILHVTEPMQLRREITIPVRLSASGMILLDMQSGEVLMSRNPDQHRAMASLTKIMTALLILEGNENLDDTITIPVTVDQVRGSTVDLKTGERFRILSLLKALLLPSANDAAYALAIADSRSTGAFVKKMNERAATLGLQHTHFTNPAGFDSPEQYSSPRDLAWLTMAALKNPEFRSIVHTKEATIFSLDGREIDLRNTNELLHENVHVLGVKTGTTHAAGECLIVLFTEHDHPYLLVLLASKDRYTDSLYLLEAVRQSSTL